MRNDVLKKYNIILASKSPRRRFLLNELGFQFEALSKDVDESFPEHLKAEEIVLYLCKKKAQAFNEEIKSNPRTLIIAADTIVWVNKHVLNKPENKTEATQMLKELSGNVHEVFTGVCLLSAEKEKLFYVRSQVYFNALNHEDIESYINTCKPFDKAGSYGAQECLPPDMNPCSEEEIFFLKEKNKEHIIQSSINNQGISFNIIKKIEGSYFNVMGMPIVELCDELVVF